MGWVLRNRAEEKPPIQKDPRFAEWIERRAEEILSVRSLGARVFRFLMDEYRAGTTLDQMYAKTDGELKRVPDLGARSLSHLRAFLPGPAGSAQKRRDPARDWLVVKRLPRADL